MQRINLVLKAPLNVVAARHHANASDSRGCPVAPRPAAARQRAGVDRS
ncbi:hypothetical protein SynM161_01564 [Synechococcus sp. M16.1]|nr:hypothetical protein SynM161_01564 [Synechococcus sp. M16.1]